MIGFASLLFIIFINFPSVSFVSRISIPIVCVRGKIVGFFTTGKSWGEVCDCVKKKGVRKF